MTEAMHSAPLRIRPDLSAQMQSSAHKAAVVEARRQRFAELTDLREKYLQMRSTRNLSGVQMFMAQDRNQFQRPHLGALGPEATLSFQEQMGDLDAIEEQVYGELAFATSQGAPVDEANARYDLALSKLVALETAIDSLTDSDTDAWAAEAEDTRSLLVSLLDDLRELNREQTSREQRSGLWLGLGTAAVVMTAVLFLSTRGTRRRRR